MKIKWTSEWGAEVSATNPDESMTDYFKKKFREAFLKEAQNFMEEVSVAVRTCKPGETITIESKPIKVRIERETVMETAQREVGEIGDGA